MICAVIMPAMLMAFGANASAAVILKETFTTLDSGSRTADSTLGGVTTEIGDQKWITSSVAFSRGGTATALAAGYSAPTAVVALPTYNETITLSADVLSYNAIDGGYWTAIGFFSNATESNWWSTNKPVAWLYITRNGHWVLTGPSSTLASGDISGYVSTVYHQLAMQYDPTDKTLKALIDGNVVASVDNFTSTVSAAGFHFQSIGITGSNTWSNNQQLDNFTVSTASVPEPAALSVLSLGSVALLVKSRK